MLTASRGSPREPRTELVALRLSLNSPVVAIEQLPRGPATAGIALHAGPGASRATLALRSVRSGQVAIFGPGEGAAELEHPEAGVDALLAFAERLGFLFDEDAIAAGGDAREAARSWAELLAGSPEEPDLPVPPPPLTKFRLRASARSAAPAPPERERSGSNFWLRLLSQF